MDNQLLLTQVAAFRNPRRTTCFDEPREMLPTEIPAVLFVLEHQRDCPYASINQTRKSMVSNSIQRFVIQFSCYPSCLPWISGAKGELDWITLSRYRQNRPWKVGDKLSSSNFLVVLTLLLLGSSFKKPSTSIDLCLYLWSHGLLRKGRLTSYEYAWWPSFSLNIVKADQFTKAFLG